VNLDKGYVVWKKGKDLIDGGYTADRPWHIITMFGVNPYMGKDVGEEMRDVIIYPTIQYLHRATVKNCLFFANKEKKDLQKSWGKLAQFKVTKYSFDVGA